ncbi:MAG: class I SAM-dependent methyltransferase, partial [Anaerolineae bacterium]|nr:class I SAM-dependent methyltransferase [Anaerolineae bacterium]
MNQHNQWQTFFDRHAGRYMEEPFVQATRAEVDFLIAQLQLHTGHRILDMGCGTGRHLLELGRRGYQVTGVDLSSGMLAQARQAADRENLVTLRFEQADATQYTTPEPFDHLYCVCEGAIGLIGTGSDPQEHDKLVLQHLYQALKPGGRMLLTVLNALRMIRLHQPADVAAGRFDPHTLTETSTLTTGAGDAAVTFTALERGFVIPELRLLLHSLGLVVEHIGGGTAGRWALRPLEL